MSKDGLKLSYIAESDAKIMTKYGLTLSNEFPGVTDGKLVTHLYRIVDEQWGKDLGCPEFRHDAEMHSSTWTSGRVTQFDNQPGDLRQPTW